MSNASDSFKDEAFSNQYQMQEKIHYLGDLRIVGQVVENLFDKDPIGYVVMAEKTQKFKMYTIEQTKALLNKFKFVNATIENGNITNTECAMNRMPKFNTQMCVIDNFGILILGEIVDGKSTVGYRAMDTNGKIVDLRESDIIKLASSTNIINAKIVNRDNGQIVSAIKSEFTKIEKHKIKELSTKDNDTKESKWRKEMRVKKYISEYIPHALRYTFTGKGSAFNSKLFYNNSNTDYSISYVDLDRETRILIKEVYKKENGFNIHPDDLELLKRLVKELPHKKVLGRQNPGEGYVAITNFDKYYFLALAQFGLYNKSIRDRLDSGYIKHNIDLNKVIVKLKENGHASKILLKTAKELTLASNSLNKKIDVSCKHPEREFKTCQFTKAEDIAQLGFAVVPQNRNYVFETKTGLKKKLKFIGDVLDDWKFLNSDYEKYKKTARCLGDILTVAYIHKLAEKYLRYVNNQDREYLSTKETLAYIEMLIAIAYLYESISVKSFVDDHKSILEDIGVNIPDYDEISRTDYKLSQDLKLYYESGYNVFYSDSNNYKYKHKYLSDAKLINYRQLGPKHNIIHEKLQGELASIVCMITSDNCSAEIVDKCIGKLRFL